MTDFTVSEGGRDFSRSYSVKPKIVTVNVQVGWSPPLFVFRMLAQEIIREAKSFTHTLKLPYDKMHHHGLVIAR